MLESNILVMNLWLAQPEPEKNFLIREDFIRVLHLNASE